MADNVSITPGTGITVATDDVGGVQFQKMKIDMGGNGASVPLVGDATYGIPVDLTRAVDLSVKPKSGEVWPVVANDPLDVADGGGSLTVDAPAGAPVFVRLSDGTNPVSGLPVSGTVAGNQGTPAAAASGWPVKITDGTSLAGISTVGSDKALKVDVIQTVETTVDDLDDLAAVAAVAGYYKESGLSDPSEGQVAALRITQKRAVHANLRNASGAEVGVQAQPIAIKIGDTPGTLPVSGTVTAQLKDDGGTAYGPTNALAVKISGTARTKVKKTASLTASQTGIELWTPASGKKFVVEFVILAVTVAGTLTVYDGANSAGNILLQGTQATGNRTFDFAGSPVPASGVNNVLRWTSGTGLVGDLVVIGYEE